MKREPRLTKRQRKEVARWQAYVADQKRRLEEAAERARVVHDMKVRPPPLPWSEVRKGLPGLEP
jgi:predicted Fe-S protein YdhL (DUF1289 family)